VTYFFDKNFGYFVLTGGIAAITNFGSRLIYNQIFDFTTSVILAYLTGMAVAFHLSKQFVFLNSKQSLPKTLFFFTLVNFLALLQSWLVSVTLAYYALPIIGVTRYVQEVAHGVGVVVPVFTSYLGHKFLSFR